jgi:hypothetical protein
MATVCKSRRSSFAIVFVTAAVFVTILHIYYDSHHVIIATATATAAVAAPSQAPSPDTSEACHFEDGNGHFETTTVNGAHGWNNWIHNSSSTLREECSIIDHVQPLQQNQYITSKPLAFLFIGDSLDNLMLNHLCKKNLGFHCLEHTERDCPADLINHAKGQKGSCKICTNDRVTFSHFNIFGMHHACKNGRYLNLSESRTAGINTTVERIEKLLPVDVLSRLDIKTNYVPLVSSSLWDLSEGCNNQLGVTEAYQELYHQGIVELYAAIHKLLPNTTVYWRTSPQVSVKYDNLITRGQGGGRTRANQETLNALLRETVSANNLGTIVDWWAQSKHIPETIHSVQVRDGRHYAKESTLAFFNMYLNAVFDRDPSLLG